MRTLVTGSAGFIGSHLVEALLAQGHHVVGIDNLSVGKKSNLKVNEWNKRFQFVEADITNNLTKHFKNIDWVFHLAARADIVPSIKSPMEYHRSNVDGTVSVLESSRFCNVKRFVYAASSSCYGIPQAYPTSELAPIDPQYPYALTKYVGECYVFHWAKVYALPAVSLRFFNVYGPRARTAGTYGAVFGVFLAQMANDKPLTVVGDGSQKRDFTYVSDVVQALIVAAESNVVGEVMNVGSGNTYSINALIDLLGAKQTVNIPRRPGEPDITFADTRKIKELLGWKANISFMEGVQLMKSEIKNFKDAPLWTPAKIKDETKDWFNFLGRELPRGNSKV